MLKYVHCSILLYMLNQHEKDICLNWIQNVYDLCTTERRGYILNWIQNVYVLYLCTSNFCSTKKYEEKEEWRINRTTPKVSGWQESTSLKRFYSPSPPLPFHLNYNNLHLPFHLKEPIYFLSNWVITINSICIIKIR